MWRKEKDIEYILEHLSDPHSVAEAEFQEWLQEKENRLFFEEVRNNREAFLRHKGYFADVRVEKELDLFKSRLRKRKMRQIRVWISAACVLVCCAIWGLVNLPEKAEMRLAENTALMGKRNAELILANGEHVPLEKNPIYLREGNGILIVNDTNQELSYKQDTFPLPESAGRQPVYNTLKIPGGADYIVRLADGTRVHLNCGTTFRYPVKFEGKERRVYLDGEAFFEVEKAEEWPFVVATEKMSVQVTGTAFNVKSYGSEESVQTTLLRGEVKVTRGEDWEHAVALMPGEQYCLNKYSGEVKVEKVNVQLFIDWTEGMFVFKNQRLEDMMNTLSRWYEIEVFYANPAIKELRLSANLGRYEHIDTILDMIRTIDKVEVIRKGNGIVISWK